MTNPNGRQQLPVEGQMDVATRLVHDFKLMIDSRVDVGISSYGTRLQSWNGRQARKDALHEILDFSMYQEQDLMETYDLLGDLVLILTADERPAGSSEIIEMAKDKIRRRQVDVEAL